MDQNLLPQILALFIPSINMVSLKLMYPTLLLEFLVEAMLERRSMR